MFNPPIYVRTHSCPILSTNIKFFTSVIVDGKPHLLWSIFFNQEWLQVDQLHCHSENSEVPANVHLVSDPTLSSGYEAAVSEVHKYITVHNNMQPFYAASLCRIQFVLIVTFLLCRQGLFSRGSVQVKSFFLLLCLKRKLAETVKKS